MTAPRNVVPAGTTVGAPLPQLTCCPDCGAPAEITRRAVLESTDGPIEHVGVRCVRKHVFLLPTFLLARLVQSQP